MENETVKPEFWETIFSDKQEMWGFEPATSAILTKDLFVRHGIKEVLIPGIGYGRNANIFREHGIAVTGIEISKTAIGLAHKHFGGDMQIFHGSVTEMPFDDHCYDGIFCYGLIHLLDEPERRKLIADCYHQLAHGGYMVFSAISKTSPTYGQGKPLGKDRFEPFEGVQLYFYDTDAIHSEFGSAGLIDISEVEEHFPFYLIVCYKGAK